MTAVAENPWVQIAPGIKRQTISTGATMYQMRAQLEAGAQLPQHQHPQEQISYVLAGRIRMFVRDVAHELAAGDSVYIPGNTSHRAEVIEDTTVLDTFSPPREDYLAADEAARNAAAAGTR
jgi:quercetin dioxygenase-like cupin family protein